MRLGVVPFGKNYGYTPSVGLVLATAASNAEEESAGREGCRENGARGEAESCPVHACQATFIAAHSDDPKFAFTRTARKNQQCQDP